MLALETLQWKGGKGNGGGRGTWRLSRVYITSAPFGPFSFTDRGGGGGGGGAREFGQNYFF